MYTHEENEEILLVLEAFISMYTFFMMACFFAFRTIRRRNANNRNRIDTSYNLREIGGRLHK